MTEKEEKPGILINYPVSDSYSTNRNFIKRV